MRATDGERKIITALFADIQGSMDLMAELDPEEAEAVVAPALALMSDAVARYEGHVVQSTGDGVFALFGAPVAYEDHARRALHAALRMQDEMRQYAERLRLEKGTSLAIRVGLNTGEVVVRSTQHGDGHADVVPVGHAIGLARRMESLATPGSVVVSEQTYALTTGFFDFQPLGAARVKGVPDPVRLYQLLGVGSIRTRLERRAASGLTRFVGRDPELAALEQALADALGGTGSAIAVVGDAGVGKSRLFHELKGAARERALVLDASCAPHGRAFSYLPIVELLQRYCDLHGDDDERRRREKVTGKVLTLERSLEDTLPHLLALLGVSDAVLALQQMAPDIRRQRAHDALTRLWVRESAERPLVVIVEDLHWLDPESERFLADFAAAVPGAAVLLLTNARPEYRETWSAVRLRLAPLRPPDARTLIVELLGERPALGAVHDLVLAKAEGNPFFMEEIVQALLEEGVLEGGAQTPVRVPASVQQVLAARIDRLDPSSKALLQTLAVLGRTASVALAREVAGCSVEDLAAGLATLETAEFLTGEESRTGTSYLFKHALTQEAAYGSLLGTHRRALHERAAGAIERLFAASLGDHSGALAHHYERSGNAEKAIEYLGRAAEQAATRSANAEAERHLEAALDLLGRQPRSAERDRRELVLQTRLGPVLVATKGHAAPAAARAYARAEALCENVGDVPERLVALHGLASVYIEQGRLPRAARLAQELLDRGARAGDEALVMEARRLLGEIRFWHGEPYRAKPHLDDVLRVYDAERHRGHALRYGDDPSVVAQGYLAVGAWISGRADEAERRAESLVEFARGCGHPYSLGLALLLAAWVRQLRREPEQARAVAEALIAVAREQGFPEWLAWGEFVRGWALAEDGDVGGGTAEMERGYAAIVQTGSTFNTSARASLAAAYVKEGRAAEALAIVDAECAALEETGARAFEAELHRIGGEALAGCAGRAGAVELRLRRALETGRRRGGLALKLRAATSLARFWAETGDASGARDVLAPVYGRFREGFATADLVEARALLETLGG
jgi:class 3 adenylate cyclase/tetratricopeptide (TPR) repeat protein